MIIDKEYGDFNGHHFGNKTSYDEIKLIVQNFYNAQSHIEIDGNYFITDREAIFSDYADQVDQFYYFWSLSQILLAHVHDISYKSTYEKASTFVESPIYNIFNMDYSRYKRVQPWNIKKFPFDFHLKKKKNGMYYFEDKILCMRTIDDRHENKASEKNFIIYKYIKVDTSKEYKNILHEGLVGYFLYNKAKIYLPNFIYTFCYFECSKPKLDNINLLNWCNDEMKNYHFVPYLIQENVNGISLDKYILKASQEELSMIFFQYDNALRLMDMIFIKHENRGTNPQNLIIYKTEKKIKIPYYEQNKKYFNSENITKSYVEANFILFVTNYEDTTIEYDYQDYNIMEKATEIMSNSVSNRPSYTSKSLLNYIKSIKPEFSYQMPPLIEGNKEMYDYKVPLKNVMDMESELSDVQKSKYQQLGYNTDCFLKEENQYFSFITFIKNEIIVVEQNLTSTDNKNEIYAICERYILFLIYLRGSTCYNFIHYMDRLYRLIQYCIRKLSLFEDNDIKKSLILTMDRCYQKLPTHHLLSWNNTISVITMISNLINRTMMYKMILTIATDIIFSLNKNVAINIIPFIFPAKLDDGIYIAIVRFISSTFVKSVVSKFLETHWIIMLLIFIQVYPSLINQTKTMWDLSLEIYESFLKTPFQKPLELFSKELEETNVEDAWEIMKTDENLDSIKEKDEEETKNDIDLFFSKNKKDNLTLVVEKIINMDKKEYQIMETHLLKGEYTEASKLFQKNIPLFQYHLLA